MADRRARQCRGGLNGNTLSYNCTMLLVCLCVCRRRRNTALIIIAEQTCSRLELSNTNTPYKPLMSVPLCQCFIWSFLCVTWAVCVCSLHHYYLPEDGMIFNMWFSLMLLLLSNGDCTPLPSPFIPTRGSGLINDWARACTERRAASRQAGSRAGRLVLFSATLCVCGQNRGHFPAEETVVYVLTQGDWAEKLAKERWR